MLRETMMKAIIIVCRKIANIGRNGENDFIVTILLREWSEEDALVLDSLTISEFDEM